MRKTDTIEKNLKARSYVAKNPKTDAMVDQTITLIHGHSIVLIHGHSIVLKAQPRTAPGWRTEKIGRSQCNRTDIGRTKKNRPNRINTKSQLFNPTAGR